MPTFTGTGTGQGRGSATTGKQERRNSAKGQARLPDLRRLYRYRRAPVRPGVYEFTFDLVGQGKKPVNLDRILTSATWTEDSATPTGHIVLQRPDPDSPRSLFVVKGQHVRCRTRPERGGKWIQLWTMRVEDPQTDLMASTVEFDITDDMYALQKNTRKWVFRKTKKRKKGYTLGDIVRAVCRKEGLKPGHVYEGKHRFSFTKTGSALDILRYAAGQEKTQSGAQLTVKLRGHFVDVVSPDRNSVLYEFQKEIEGAVLQTVGAANPATVIIATGHIGKGKKAKKVKATVQNRSVVQKLGRVVDEKDYGTVKSRKELMTKAQRDLAQAVKQTRTADITVRGIPYIHRGQGARWVTREPGWYGQEKDLSKDRTFVFVTAVTQTLTPPDYTTQLSISQKDPFVAEQKAKDAAKRKAARSRRKSRRKRGGK